MARLWSDCEATTVPGGLLLGELYVFLSQLAGAGCLACLRNSAWNSWVSLDRLPTLAKGRTETEEREDKLVLIRSSVFSLRREPALCGPEEPGPFRGMVYRWAGGVLKAGDGTCLSPVALEPFPALSSWAVLLVKDWERFFRGLSSKNSMTKAFCESALP